jgi:hypothetical protein
MKLAAAARLCVALGVAGPAAAQTVINGGFEAFTGAFAGDGGAQLIPTSTTLTGWTIVGGEIAVLRTPNIYSLAPSSGSNFLDLAGYSNGGFPKGISQSLTGLNVGQTYSFSMDVGIRNGACVGGGNNCHGPVQVSATIGGTGQTFTEASSTAGNVWGTFGFNFIATSPSMTLTINGVSLPAGNAFIGLDNVSVAPGAVAAVPEPGTWALMLSGLIAVGWLGRRKNRST